MSVGTRVPLQNLIDYLEGDESVEDFLEAFPTVKREQAIAVIEAGKLKMLETQYLTVCHSLQCRRHEMFMANRTVSISKPIYGRDQ